MIAPAERLEPHVKDIGGLEVRRLLPGFPRQMVGPFIFFDHIGPARFAPGQGVDVRPHPHIGLATVTYLFEGAILHRDSLGAVQRIEPGDVNWMTAGAGILHSERTAPEDRAAGSPLHGIQTWLALPLGHEQAAPAIRRRRCRKFSNRARRSASSRGMCSGSGRRCGLIPMFSMPRWSWKQAGGSRFRPSTRSVACMPWKATCAWTARRSRRSTWRSSPGARPSS